jgi:hypothetical protein
MVDVVQQVTQILRRRLHGLATIQSVKLDGDKDFSRSGFARSFPGDGCLLGTGGGRDRPGDTLFNRCEAFGSLAEKINAGPLPAPAFCSRLAVIYRLGTPPRLTPASGRVVERIRLLEQMAALLLLALPHRPRLAA